MTLNEFENTAFGAGMKAVYISDVYAISAVNFQEFLIELRDDDDQCIWVRCENIELVENKEND